MITLYVVESADYTFIMNQTGLTWGNLSSHMRKLENAGYVAVEKTFVGKKPHTLAALTDAGRDAFQTYRKQIANVLDDLPD
ncbi:MAG: transcriptional regulator [Chloroflexi bacterium]|nr:transcriptional regulator [Chloroflexota bacterium]